jgi:hypothetical protein
MKMKVGAAALLMSLVTANQAFAGYLNLVPPSTSPRPIPEFDGPGAIAAVALLASAVAIAFHRSRSR